jgi:AAA15 family ATPase/GTPase
MLDRVIFTKYKGFDNFVLRFTDKNMLIGPNNAGKSTIISALRLLTAMVGHASRRSPNSRFRDGDRDVLGFTINAMSTRELAGFISENVKHEFGPDNARIDLKFATGAIVHAIWPAAGEPYFYIDKLEGMQARTPSAVKESVSTIGVIPPLWPIEHREEVLTQKYVTENQNSRLSSRHFRNQLFFLRESEPASYDEFIEYALENTPEITSLRVVADRSGLPHELDLFFVETGSSREKELFWAGRWRSDLVADLVSHLP